MWYLQVDHWLEFSARRLCGQPGLTVALGELDKALSLRTFLVGHAITLADLSVWAALKGQYHPGFFLSALLILFFLGGIYAVKQVKCSTTVVVVSLQVTGNGQARAKPSPMSIAGSPS